MRGRMSYSIVWFRLVRLVFSVLWEGCVFAVQALLFPFFQRRRLRDDVRRALARRIGAVVLGGIGLLGSGCANNFPGAGFQKQVDELGWTAARLVEQPNWHKSLWSDVKAFTDPELDQFPQSIEMIGW
jgi:hypothetical protein